jgi:hypothetical protein
MQEENEKYHFQAQKKCHFKSRYGIAEHFIDSAVSYTDEMRLSYKDKPEAQGFRQQFEIGIHILEIFFNEGPY